jgi:hypothetical protein
MELTPSASMQGSNCGIEAREVRGAQARIGQYYAVRGSESVHQAQNPGGPLACTSHGIATLCSL